MDRNLLVPACAKSRVPLITNQAGIRLYFIFFENTFFPTLKATLLNTVKSKQINNRSFCALKYCLSKGVKPLFSF